MINNQRLRLTQRVILIGSLVDLLLAIIKIGGGWLTNSQALIADGIHSLSDLASDAMILIAARLSHAEADAEHPYGHERIDTVAALTLGLILIAIGILLGWRTLLHLFDSTQHAPAASALFIALLSVVGKEAIFRYTMHYARALRSPMLKASAWHSRSDAWSSVVVIIGIGGAQLGWYAMDAIAALVVALLIVFIGAKLVSHNIAELIDTALRAEDVAQIRAVILSVQGIRSVHTLRTRHMGPKVLVDVHVLLRHSQASVSEGHHISDIVRQRLCQELPEISDVTVHIDPEDDEYSTSRQDLPLRDTVVTGLQHSWHGIEAVEQVLYYRLHYLNQKLFVDVELPLAVLDNSDPQVLQRTLESKAMAHQPDIAKVRLLFVSHALEAGAGDIGEDKPALG